jgi:hypothetical protein
MSTAKLAAGLAFAQAVETALETKVVAFNYRDELGFSYAQVKVNSTYPPEEVITKIVSGLQLEVDLLVHPDLPLWVLQLDGRHRPMSDILVSTYDTQMCVTATFW